MYITRKAEFSASHACWRADWPAERNRAVYGAASSPRGHGHNFLIEVTLEGEPDPVTGMIVDLKLVKDIIQREVVDVYDHRFLNHEVAPFDQLTPTAENIAMDIWGRLDGCFAQGPARLRNVRLYETGDLFVDYAGS